MSAYQFHDFDPPKSDMKREVMAGFRNHPKTIDPKYLYDARGAVLFEEIVKQPEYYPPDAEKEIIATRHAEIAQALGENVGLIEYGSGAMHKVRPLIETLRPKAFMAVDISTKQLRQAATDMAASYPWLEVHATCANFIVGFPLSDFPQDIRRIVLFLGSSLGNFDRATSLAILRHMRTITAPNGGALIGIDLVKSPETLNAAYNDAAGVTAEFNRNVLRHLNEALGADFALENFAHEAFYNPDEKRIEVWLRCLKSHEIRLGGETFSFHEGERIHTENSQKYEHESFLETCREAGFQNSRIWSDNRGYFSLCYLT